MDRQEAGAAGAHDGRLNTLTRHRHHHPVRIMRANSELGFHSLQEVMGMFMLELCMK